MRHRRIANRLIIDGLQIVCAICGMFNQFVALIFVRIRNSRIVCRIHRLGGRRIVVADLELSVLIKHELTPTVSGAGQHVVEALVVLHQIREHVL